MKQFGVKLVPLVFEAGRRPARDCGVCSLMGLGAGADCTKCLYRFPNKSLHMRAAETNQLEKWLTPPQKSQRLQNSTFRLINGLIGK